MARPQLTVNEASETYESAMRNVLPAGDGVCATCGTWIEPTYSYCYPCNSQPSELAAVVPITYSEHLGQMHLALRRYKDGPPSDRHRMRIRLCAMLWRFALQHEQCVADAAGAPEFDLVTTVPSSSPTKDDGRGNLRWIVKRCGPLKKRYERVLLATGDADPNDRSFDPDRYKTTERLDGRHVLLIDDTWTRGGHAQSAAHTLRQAGAETVALIVIGRHVNPDWEVNGVTCGDRFGALPRAFDWERCRVHPAQS